MKGWVSSVNVLLYGASCMILVALVLAWIATFSKLIVVGPIRDAVKDYHSLIRAHIDLMLMALFCLSFFNLHLDLPLVAIYALVIGGFTNPSLFLLRAFRPEAGQFPLVRLYRVASFSITSFAFVWVATSIFVRALSR